MGYSGAYTSIGYLRSNTRTTGRSPIRGHPGSQLSELRLAIGIRESQQSSCQDIRHWLQPRLLTLLAIETDHCPYLEDLDRRREFIAREFPPDYSFVAFLPAMDTATTLLWADTAICPTDLENDLWNQTTHYRRHSRTDFHPKQLG